MNLMDTGLEGQATQSVNATVCVDIDGYAAL